MEASFSSKLEKIESNHETQIKALHDKIGQQSVELGFLERASSWLGL